MRRRTASGWIAATASLVACGGCGFKGPLYLPEHRATVVTHPAPAGAQGPAGAVPERGPQPPAARKKDNSPPGSPPPPLRLSPVP